MVERYHNEFRESDKVRGWFKSDETAQQGNYALDYIIISLRNIGPK